MTWPIKIHQYGRDWVWIMTSVLLGPHSISQRLSRQGCLHNHYHNAQQTRRKPILCLKLMADLPRTVMGPQGRQGCPTGPYTHCKSGQSRGKHHYQRAQVVLQPTYNCGYVYI